MGAWVYSLQYRQAQSPRRTRVLSRPTPLSINSDSSALRRELCGMWVWVCVWVGGCCTRTAGQVGLLDVRRRRAVWAPAFVAMNRAQELNSRRTLEEITERVDEALNAYEKMEENNPDKFDGIRRKTEIDATFAELAGAGRARVDVYMVALNEIAEERQKALMELRAKLENERRQAEEAEREERHDGRHRDDDETMDEAMLLERLETLESLQQRLADTGTSLLDLSKSQSAAPVIKKLKGENAELTEKLDEVTQKRLLLTSDLHDKMSTIKRNESELHELRDELRSTKEKLGLANARAKEAKSMGSMPTKRESFAVKPSEAASAPKTVTSEVGVGTTSEPMDAAPPFEFPAPSPGTFDNQLSNLEQLIDSLGEQLRDDWKLPHGTVASLESLLLDYAGAVRESHVAAIRNVGNNVTSERPVSAGRPVSATTEGGSHAAPAPAPPPSERPPRRRSGPRPPPPPPMEASSTESPQPDVPPQPSALEDAAPTRQPPPQPTAPARTGRRSSLAATGLVEINEAEDESVSWSRRVSAAPDASVPPQPMLAPATSVVETANERPPPGSAALASSRRQSIARERRGSLRGSGGLESETERAQKVLYETKRDLAAEADELAKVRQTLVKEREQLAEILRIAQTTKDLAGSDSTAVAEADEKLKEIDAQMEDSFKSMKLPVSTITTAQHDAEVQALNEKVQQASRNQVMAENALRQLEVETVRKLELLKEAMSDEHTIDLEDAEELRVVCVQVLHSELESAEKAAEQAGENAREQLIAATAAKVGGSGSTNADADVAMAAAAVAAAEAGRKELEEKVVQLEAAAEESVKELTVAREALTACEAQRKQVEAELEDAQKAINATGGGAAELFEARREVARLQKANSSAEATQALQTAERDEIAQRARALGRAEGEAAMEEALTARTGEMQRRIIADAALLNSLQAEIVVADTSRKDAEAAVIEAASRMSAAGEWARQRVAEADAFCEARLTAAMAAKASASESEREARRESAQLEDNQTRLRKELAAANEKLRDLTDKWRSMALKAVSGGGTTGLPNADESSSPPVAAGVQEEPSPSQPTGEEKDCPVVAEPADEVSVAADGGDEAPRASAPLMSQKESMGLLERTQNQLLEVAALSEFEHNILLGNASPNQPMHPSLAALKKPTVVAPTSGTASTELIGGSTTAGKVVAGSGSRIAWLLREGIGHTSSMGIRGLVRPTTRSMDNQQLRRVLRTLFSQQRSLTSQSAVGNWELLGTMVLLLPKQLDLQSVHDSMVAEANSTDNEQRRAELAMQLPRVSGLSASREEQRRWCCKVWDLRRQAVSAISSRLMSQTLYALTKLTDAANTEPAFGSLSPASARAPSPRAKKRDALVSAIFSAPPILPFMQPPRADSISALARPADEWADWSGTTGAPTASHDMWGGRGGALTTDQMQRLFVAAQHWPSDFGQLGARLQRQVLAEAVAYCITGSMQRSASDGPQRQGRRPTTAPRVDEAAAPPPPGPADPHARAELDSLLGASPTGHRPVTAPVPHEPGSAKPARAVSRGGELRASSGFVAGQPVILRPRPVAETPRAIFSS
jgi:hypothetical protein